MKRILSIIVAAAALALMAASCSTYKKINYLQDAGEGDSSMSMAVNQGIIIQPKDMMSIVVSSRVPELSRMFNLPVASYQAGSEIVTTGNQRLLGYVVDNDGCIDFPELGQLHVAGLTRWEVSKMIKDELSTRGLLEDPVVTVEFMNFKISVMGEVVSPGTFSIAGDKITLLEALSLARDLTIYGRRDRVFVIREQNGERNIYKVDLRSVDLFNSPAYYLQQNDVVYVEPNAVKAGQSTINENNLKSVSLWVSIGSFVTTLATLLVNVIPHL